MIKECNKEAGEMLYHQFALSSSTELIKKSNNKFTIVVLLQAGLTDQATFFHNG